MSREERREWGIRKGKNGQRVGEGKGQRGLRKEKEGNGE